MFCSQNNAEGLWRVLKLRALIIKTFGLKTTVIK
jgi:hypothetical protein